MLSIFLFKSNARGMRNGMGAYIRELTDALLVHTDVKVYNVTYHNSVSKEFTIETISTRCFNINIPAPWQSFSQTNLYSEKYASIVVNLLSLVISKDEKIVFQINYADGLHIIKRLKEKYTHPVISVIHIAQWQQFFNGNRLKLKNLNIDNPKNNIELTIFNEKEMYQLSDHIISVTRYMKDFLVEEYDIIPDKINIVPNCINYSKYQHISQEEKLKLKHKLGFNPQDKIILFSGNIDDGEGIFPLLEAFVEACRYIENIRLVVIGQGDIQECLQKYQSFYGKITFTGYLPSEQVMAFYQITDVGVVPSIYDHCPYAALEMIAYKIPLILSRIDGINEIFNEDQCVFIEPLVNDEGEIFFDIKEFRNAILSVTRNNIMSEKIALEAFRDKVVKFSASNMALKMNNIYTNLTVCKKQLTFKS